MVAQIPNSHLFVNSNDVTVFVDSKNIYTSDHPSLFGVGVPHPADRLLCFSTVSPLRIDKKKPPETANACTKLHRTLLFFGSPFPVQYRHGGSRDGRSPGDSCSFWFLDFRCWAIGDRKREEDSRWKGNGNNQGRKSGRTGFFFGVRLAVRIAWFFFSFVF